MGPSKIRIGIVGGAGFTGGELIRILINHPFAELSWVLSASQTGKPLYATHTDLIGETALFFTDQADYAVVDVVFLCSGHGQSLKYLNENNIPPNVKIIDLSTDFRDEKNGFVYGLPELNLEKIKHANKIANPGCFATAIQLGILPLAAHHKIKETIHISAVTGSTGAGQALSPSTHFSWRNNNASVYKPFEHQHLAEIKQSLNQLQGNLEEDILFIPYRGNFTRGILANIYTPFDGTEEDAIRLYKDFYKNEAFCTVIDQPLDLKMVVNTNKCLIQIAKHGKQIFISSAIDNLLKGASGQAVQNMNIMFNIDETTGLKLKPSGF
jgi:N-acetyl-gamma-glutamyl-phosphate reductase